MQKQRLRRGLKNLYKAIPAKQVLYRGLRRVWVPPESVSRYLSFRDVFTVKVGERSFRMNHYGFDIETSVFWRGLAGCWEGRSLTVWAKLCSRSHVIFDIGANTGIYALVAKTVNPASEVHGFEPVERVFRKLQANRVINQFDITCRPEAVSDYDGDGIVYDLPTEHIYSATLNKNLHGSGNAAAAIARPVKTIRLDTYMDRLGLQRLDLMKIDVESHEPEVLVGLGRYLELMKPTILLEVWNDEVGERVEHALSGLGYLFFHTDERDPFRLAERVVNPAPSEERVNYLACVPGVAEFLGLAH
jgi:FkbM family methyltransferase